MNSFGKAKPCTSAIWCSTRRRILPLHPPHERFEAFALSVREFLARRWVDTESTYARENPKRVYYLSMEFLIGRSLANNVINLLLDADARRAVKEIDFDWLAILEQEADAGLGNGGLGAWRPVSWIPWPLCRFQQWDMG